MWDSRSCSFLHQAVFTLRLSTDPDKTFLELHQGLRLPLLPSLLSQVSDLHWGPKTVPAYACPFSPFPFTGLQGTSGMSQAILVSASWMTQTDTPAQPHSTNEETEAHRDCESPKITQPVSDRVGFKPRFFSLQSWYSFPSTFYKAHPMEEALII